MDKEDLLLFLNKKVRLNLIINGANRYYNGAVVFKVNSDDFMFKDKYNALVSASIDSIQKIEEIKNGENFSEGFGRNEVTEKKFKEKPEEVDGDAS